MPAALELYLDRPRLLVEREPVSSERIRCEEQDGVLRRSLW
jgi:hypothetical protein